MRVLPPAVVRRHQDCMQLDLHRARDLPIAVVQLPRILAEVKQREELDRGQVKVPASFVGHVRELSVEKIMSSVDQPNRGMSVPRRVNWVTAAWVIRGSLFRGPQALRGFDRLVCRQV